MKKYVVIGAGILGASTAYHLAKSGADVTIIDRMDVGQATDAAAGIVCPWLSQRRNKAWYFLAKNGAKYYPTLVQELRRDGQVNTGYSKVGALSLHTDTKKLDKKEAIARKRLEEAPEMGEITRLAPEEVQRLFPPLSDQFHAIHVSGGARVNGRSIRDALINGSIKHGADFIKGEASIQYRGGKILGVRINSTFIDTNDVIVTAGIWAKEILKPLGYDLTITAQRGQIAHLKLENPETGTWPVIMPPNNQYILAFEGGRIVIGTTHEDIEKTEYRVTLGGLHEIVSKALLTAPGLVFSHFIETRVGFRPFTPGFLPIIGKLPGIERVFIANGLGSSGLTVGPYLGAELAKLALGQPTELDIDQYNVIGALKRI